MKKAMAALLCGVMLLGFSACGNAGTVTESTSAANTTAADTQTEAAESNAAADTTAAESETTTAAVSEETTSEAVTEAATETTTEAAIEQTTAEAVSEETTAQSGDDEEMNDSEEEKKLVALTFDDGPNTTTTNEVLDILEKYGVKASFFLIGVNINDDSAKAVKRAYDMGCDIGNHSKTHSNMTELTDEEIVDEIKYVDDRIYEITGEYPKYFRPPYIAVNNKMFDLIDETFINGFGVTDYDDRVTTEIRHMRVMKQVKDGAIILLHDAQGNSQTVEALDLIIPDLISEGYELVTLTELFERKGVTLGDEKILYSYADQTSMYG